MKSLINSILSRYTMVQEIYKGQYDEAKKDMTDDAFNKEYTIKNKYGTDRYYKIVDIPNVNPENMDEVNLYVADRILRELENANRHIRVIKGIMIAIVICSIFAALIILF